jgi:hypothetical protein
MKRLLAATVVAVALPVLAACSGGGEPIPTAEAVVPTHVEPDATATPDIAGGDEFCDLAVASVPVGEAIEAKTADMSTTIVEALGAGDMATINAWGSELSALDEDMLQFYAEGRPYIEGDSVEGAWNLMEQFVRDYSLAVAQEAATASDPNDFTARLGEIVQNPEVQAAVNFGPAAAASIRQYIVTRCGPVDAA